VTLTDIADATIDLGELALLLGLTDRSSLHADGKTLESVTDHSIMLGLVACALAEVYAPDLDQGRIAIFCQVHDAVEGYAKDTSTLRLLSPAALADKANREGASFNRIEAQFAGKLPWLAYYIGEYERQNDYEALWVKAVDKLVVKITHILNRCAAPLRDGMTVAELTARYDAQYEELFGRNGYARDFPYLARLYRNLVDRELAIFAERLAEPVPAGAERIDPQKLRRLLDALRSPFLCNWDPGVAHATADLLDDPATRDTPGCQTLARALLRSFGIASE